MKREAAKTTLVPRRCMALSAVVLTVLGMGGTRTAMAGTVLSDESQTAVTASSEAGTLLSRQSEYAAVRAYGGYVAWTQKAENGQTVLVTTFHGIERRFPGFRSTDFDLGPNSAGKTVAVYARGGDVFQLDLESGRSTRIRVAGRTLYRESRPSIWGDRLAFVRCRGGICSLRLGSISTRRTNAIKVLRDYWVGSVDLRGRTVVFSLDGTQIWIQTVRRKTLVREVHESDIGISRNVGSPSFDGDYVYYAQISDENGPNQLMRYHLRSGKQERASVAFQGSPVYLYEVAWAEGGFVFSGSPDDGSAESVSVVVRVANPRFRPLGAVQ